MAQRLTELKAKYMSGNSLSLSVLSAGRRRSMPRFHVSLIAQRSHPHRGPLVLRTFSNLWVVHLSLYLSFSISVSVCQDSRGARAI